MSLPLDHPAGEECVKEAGRGRRPARDAEVAEDGEPRYSNQGEPEQEVEVEDQRPVMDEHRHQLDRQQVEAVELRWKIVQPEHGWRAKLWHGQAPPVVDDRFDLQAGK